MKVQSEQAAVYKANPQGVTSDHRKGIIAAAISILEENQNHGDVIGSPKETREYLFLKLAERKAEVFCVLFLDNRHRVIEFRELFQGTIDGCSVHPREVVRACLDVNAAAVILAHNHPSGEPEPSRADIQLTKRLVDAMGLVDVRVLDHIVVGDTAAGCASFAERGLI